MTELDTGSYWRQLDVISPDVLAKFKPTIIGLGGLGSPTVQALAKMGVKEFTFYDDDSVEEHNIPNQMYGLEDIGTPKIEAMTRIALNFGATSITANNERVTDQKLSGPVICGVDSMEARSEIWGLVKYNPSVPLFIDMRMSLDSGMIFAVNPSDPDDIKYYEAFLYSDEEAAEDPCTAQAIIFNTLTIASAVCRIVKRYVCDEELHKQTLVGSGDSLAIYELA